MVDEIIVSSSWAVDNDDIELSLPAFSDTVATIWASGGLNGKSYTLTNTITTDQDRTDERSITLSCEVR